MSENFEINEEICRNTLRQYIEVGYKMSGLFSISDAAAIHETFTEVSKEDCKDKESHYRKLFDIIELCNKNRCFTLNDGVVLDTVKNFLLPNKGKEQAEDV